MSSSADVTAAPGADPDQVREAVQNAAREQLLPHEMPRFVRMVDEIRVSAARKTMRQADR